MYTTLDHRPTSLFTEENYNKNDLKTTNNTMNKQRSSINIQKLTDINLRHKPSNLIAGSTIYNSWTGRTPRKIFFKFFGTWMNIYSKTKYMNL